MEMKDKNIIDLDFLLAAGILPMAISATGCGSEPLEEIIVCEAISGGAAYVNGMPEHLTLARYKADGTEYRARYSKESVTEEVMEKELKRIAHAMHYPDCWDTSVYPTLLSAIRERRLFLCGNDCGFAGLPLEE